MSSRVRELLSSLMCFHFHLAHLPQVYISEFTMEDGKGYIAKDYIVVSDNHPSEQTPLTFTRTTSMSGGNLCLVDIKVPKIVLVVGKIVEYGEDENPEIVDRTAIAIVLDPADGSGKTFTHKLVFELENEDKTGNADVFPCYSPVDSEGFCRDYQEFTAMILWRAPPVKRGLVCLGWQPPGFDRKEVWLNPPRGVEYTVEGLFDNKAQCFDMGNGFRLLVPGFMDFMQKRERAVPASC